MLYDNRKLTKALYLYWKDIEKGFNYKAAFLLFNFEGTSAGGAEVTDEDMHDPQVCWAALGAAAEGAPKVPRQENPHIKKIISR